MSKWTNYSIVSGLLRKINSKLSTEQQKTDSMSKAIKHACSCGCNKNNNNMKREEESRRDGIKRTTTGNFHDSIAN